MLSKSFTIIDFLPFIDYTTFFSLPISLFFLSALTSLQRNETLIRLRSILAGIRRRRWRGHQAGKIMCPLRLILVFLSATLAGYFAWKSFRSSPDPSLVSGDSSDADGAAVDENQKVGAFRAKKVIGDGLWTFVDMASGRYLWRAIKNS